tara:strand:- start:56 stop:202 length:147 start_codon:yes stop_codon:yes gene_type:complete
MFGNHSFLARRMQLRNQITNAAAKGDTAQERKLRNELQKLNLKIKKKK